jgi:hypothetical protein
MPKSKNVSISFTVTPDLKDQLTSHAKAASVSRSKAIATMVTEYLNKKSEPVVEPANEVLEFDTHGVRQIEIEKIIELIELYEEYSDESLIPYTHCDLDDKDIWDDKQHSYFLFTEMPKLTRFLAIADEVNSIIWQIDNSFQFTHLCGWDDGTLKVIEKLDTYGLFAPYNVSPCNARELWAFIQTLDWSDSFASIIVNAVRKERPDVIAAMVEWKPPVERKSYWKEQYTSRLGTKDIEDIWEWKHNPEAHEICDELTMVLNWEKPEREIEMILKVLHENKDPFAQAETVPVVCQNSDGTTTVNTGINFGTQGRYCNWKNKGEVKAKFRAWHEEKQFLYDSPYRNLLHDIYKVVFGCDFSVIMTLLEPVLDGEWYDILGLDKDLCTRQDIKTAYRNLAKFYHPDVNSSPNAPTIFRNLTKAKTDGEAHVSRRGYTYNRNVRF